MEKNAASNSFTFDAQMARLLRYYYDRAVAEGKEQFMFVGHVLLVDYAKYLLEYVEKELNIESKSE